MALSSSSSVPQIPIVVSSPSPYGETEPIRRVLLLAALGLLRARAMMVLSAIVFAIGGVIIARREPTMFTAQSTFIIQEAVVAAPTPFTALMGGAAGNTQLEYYDALLQTRALLKAAVDTTYAISTEGGVRVRPVNVLDSAGTAAAIPVEQAANRLRGRATLSKGKAGIINLNVKAAHPHLARQLNDRVLDLLNRFNLERKRTRVVAERRFVERRLEEVSDELRQAEERWMDFQRRNRNIGSSAELMFEQQRLQRAVDLKQGLVSQLTQNMEQARIEEVRDTPVLTVWEPALEPTAPDGSPVKGYLIFGAVLGMFLVGVLAIIIEIARRWPTPPDSLRAELSRAVREAIGDVRRPWRPFARLVGIGR